MNNESDRFIDSVWVDLNTNLIEAENRAARRKRVTLVMGWVVAITAAAVLASLIFWFAITAAQAAATAAPLTMRF